jgi:hypothetical protein
MADYIDYVKTVKKILEHIHDRIAAMPDIKKCSEQYGLPIGLSKSSLNEYVSKLENVILEAIFIHAFAESEKNIYDDLANTIASVELKQVSNFSSKCSFDPMKFKKELVDFDSIAKVIKFNDSNLAAINLYKKLRDYYAHGKRFPADEFINSIIIKTEIENMLDIIKIK